MKCTNEMFCSHFSYGKYFTEKEKEPRGKDIEDLLKETSQHCG